MKDILHLMARYNLATDEELFGLLGNLKSEELTRDTGGYFGSLMGLLNHLLVSDLGWFTAYRNSDLHLPALESPVLDYKNPGWAKPLHEDFAALQDHQLRMDQLFITLIEQSEEGLLLGNITLKRSNGTPTSATFGRLLMHLLNHHTHHRGAISQILDAWGIENDYSNLTKLIF